MHVGACFEFVLADVIADYWRLSIGVENVRLNLGMDEHGQKIAQKANELGIEPQDHCDQNAARWIEACKALGITYDNFYRTSSPAHKEKVLRFTEQLSEFIFERDYEGFYCVGCEAYKTSKEVVDGRCVTHGTVLPFIKERVKCFDIQKFALRIEDHLVDKTLSNELKNILAGDFDFPITRNNVRWAIPFEDGTLHCWWEALQGFLFAAGLYNDSDSFQDWWANSLQLCGKDNLKFQAYIFQAMLLAAGLPQTKEILVHGMILDEKGTKMSKSLGNVVDPIVQLEKYGRGALRYYLTLGLNTYGDSAFSEKDLVNIWNKEVVGGFGNLVARILHLVDVHEVKVTENEYQEEFHVTKGDRLAEVRKAFERHDFHEVRTLLNSYVSDLNRRVNDERPFDPAVTDRKRIIGEILLCLEDIAPFYAIILKEPAIFSALDGGKKVILFEKLTVKDEVPV